MPVAGEPRNPPGESPAALRFGPFEVQPDRRLLLKDGVAVELGSRAFDLLLALVRRQGELVRKDALMAEVWPDTNVEEVNLRVHLSLLRKALGDGQDGRRYILTIPGRGYRFVCPIAAPDAAAAPPAGPARAGGALPRSLTRMIGRERIVNAILPPLRTHRCVTLVGPGGIGKTTLAVHVAERLLPAFRDGTTFVDLSVVAQDALVAPAVAFAIGVSSFADDPSPGIVACLKSSRRLLVLDCCERVAAGVAALVEQILRDAPEVQVLATSREPLRAEGEWVLRVPPLDMPPVAAALTATEALGYPAVQLFVERVSAVLDGFELTDADVPAVAAICARLDGIALAIELAAAHAGAFDLDTLAELLKARFRLLARGRRTAVARHQTMWAVLDWSYDTIPPQEQSVLRRLAVFDGSFSLGAAEVVTGEAGAGEAGAGEAVAGESGDITICLANLVDKSLVATRPGPAGMRYRLLDMTRAYAMERLVGSGEYDATARRHAAHCLAIFQDAEHAWPERTVERWLADYEPELDNVRAALDWCFSPSGDAALGVRLSAVAVPLMFELSLIEECRRRAAQALGFLAAGDAAADGRVEMRLRATLAAALTYTPGPVPETAQAWREVLAIATRFDDVSIRSRAVWGLWTAHCYGGRPREALDQAREFVRLAAQRSDPARQVLGERITGVALHYLGDQDAAGDMLGRMVARYAPGEHRWQTLGFAIDHGLMARATLARIHWLQARPGEALRMGRETLAAVRSQGHAISICYVLSEAAIPLALMAEDAAGAAEAQRLLQDIATQNGMAIWLEAARFIHLVVRIAAGEAVAAAALREALTALRRTGYTVHVAALCGVAADGLAAQGELAAAGGLVEEALAACAANHEGWALAELLRVQGRLALATAGGAGAATDCLRRAIDLARQQRAPTWELRAATTLAHAAGEAAAAAEARALVGALLARFAAEADTADTIRARAVLQSP